jgi:conserved oligomeric Golgi complex subunit 8
MVDPLYELLQPQLLDSKDDTSTSTSTISKYLSRLVSLRLSDLTTTESQSLSQSAQSNLVSIQALSSRSHRTTTVASDHLSTLRTSIPHLTGSVSSIKAAIPDLDAGAVKFASSYGRSRDEATQQSKGQALLTSRRNAALLSRQADKAQDILELPSVLRASIAAANSAGSSTSGANYSQALDLFAHIKRLQMLYPESKIVESMLVNAKLAMKDMTTNLIAGLRAQNLRLAAAIRMIGWLRRVMPDLSITTPNREPETSKTAPSAAALASFSTSASAPDEGHFGALFLIGRLCTFLTTTEALAPLRELADQETEARNQNATYGTHNLATTSTATPPPTRRSSGNYNPLLAGQQTERYLKRYIEIFREQSFATISMYRNIFPTNEESMPSTKSSSIDANLTLPSALQTFPMYLVELFMETLKQYLPNVTESAARESLLMQVLYAANSLGRLGADFSLMIAELYEDEEAAPLPQAIAEEKQCVGQEGINGNEESSTINEPEERPPLVEPEWIAVIKKHRVQVARLEAMAAGQERAAQRQPSVKIPVR